MSAAITKKSAQKSAAAKLPSSRSKADSAPRLAERSSRPAFPKIEPPPLSKPARPQELSQVSIRSPQIVIPQDRTSVPAPVSTIELVATIAAELGEFVKGAAASANPPSPSASPPSQQPSTEPALSVRNVRSDVLGETLSVGMLVAAMNAAIGVTVNPLAVRQLLESTIDAMGVRGDPLGTILAEQILLMRIVSGNLHALTLLGTTAGEKSIVNTAAIGISAELRRTVLALAAYRETASFTGSSPGPQAAQADDADEFERMAS